MISSRSIRLPPKASSSESGVSRFFSSVSSKRGYLLCLAVLVIVGVIYAFTAYELTTNIVQHEQDKYPHKRANDNRAIVTTNPNEEPRTAEERLLKEWTPVWKSVNLEGFPNVLNPPRKDMSDSELLPLPWGSVYPHRVWCSVLTMWPARKENIEAVAATWGSLCDRLVFVVDRQNASEPVPDSYEGFDIIKLNIQLPQSKKDRNIWEKSWRTWQHVGTHHLDDADWFLKIDDDTFFSAVNFKGFARYLNPYQPYYLGHTLMHLWPRINVVFNAGSCYALSRESLRRLTPTFSSYDFTMNAKLMRRNKGCVCLCTDRPRAFEDPAMGTCMHALGIDPLNTLNAGMSERFSPLRESYMKRIGRKDWWYFKLKALNVSLGAQSMDKYPISFHFYKKEPMKHYVDMHKRHNNAEDISGVSNGKYFPIPDRPRRFLHQPLTFRIDEYRNTLKPPSGQKIFKGNESEPFMVDRDKFPIKEERRRFLFF